MLRFINTNMWTYIFKSETNPFCYKYILLVNLYTYTDIYNVSVCILLMYLSYVCSFS